MFTRGSTNDGSLKEVLTKIPSGVADGRMCTISTDGEGQIIYTVY